MAVLWDLRDFYQLTLEWTRGAISRVKYREYDQIIFVPNCNNTHRLHKSNCYYYLTTLTRFELNQSPSLNSLYYLLYEYKKKTFSSLLWTFAK